MRASPFLISVLAYGAAFSWPLTLAEIAERMRIFAPLSDIATRLDGLVATGVVRTSMGMYALESVNTDVFDRRVEAEKTTAQKWRRMRRAAWWLQAVPFVSALLASGSLVTGTMDEASDWDVFVIARSGRMYTARLFLLAAARLMGRLRTKHDATAPDKFCFNHYVTTDGLSIRHRSLYVAQGIASMLPLYDPEEFLGRIRTSNEWTGEYVHGSSGALFVRREVIDSRLLAAVRYAIETLLASPVGERIEHLARSWQQRRIAREPATHAPGGRVIADDRELEFHPRSFEAVAMSRYNTTLTRLNLGQYHESDSGLNR